jgi:hypothetical protein
MYWFATIYNSNNIWACFPPASWDNRCLEFFFLSVGVGATRISFLMGQNLVQGHLRHVQLLPDRGQRNFGLLKIDGCPLNLLWPWFSWVFVDRIHDKMQLAKSEIVGLPFYHLKQKVFGLRRWKLVWFISIHLATKRKNHLPIGLPGRLQSLKEHRPSLVSPAVDS